MRKRRTFTPEFKTERLHEVLTGDLTPAEVCRIHQLSPQQLAEWKPSFWRTHSWSFNATARVKF
jgi:transposase-like protein